MEPPPLTVTKKRDPLRNAFEQQDPPVTSGPLQVFRPNLQPGPFQQSAADAAAINRSVEAERIRREFSALVGSSPLPQAVRQPLSVISYQQRLAGLQGSYSSPAAVTPALRGFQLPPPALIGSGAAPASRLQHGLQPTFSPAEPQAVPAARYPSVVQQWQQEQPQQHVADGSFRPGANVEVETSKFTRVLHSHSPSYQAVVSSTVEVVRQTSARPLQQPQVLGNWPPGHAACPAAVVEELPTQLPSLPGRQDIQQAQQQHNPPPQQQPVVVLQLPVLRSPPTVPSASTQGVQPAAGSPEGLRSSSVLAALGIGSRGSVELQEPALPLYTADGEGSTQTDRHVRQPPGPLRQEQQQPGGQQPEDPVQRQVLQQQVQEAVGVPHEELAPSLQSPAGTVSRLHGLPELGGVQGATPTSMQKAMAMAQVASLVRDLSSPVPDEPPKAGCVEEGTVRGGGQKGAAEELPAAPASAAGLGAGPSRFAAQQHTADMGVHHPSCAEEQQQQQPQEQQQEVGQMQQADEPAAEGRQATAAAENELSDEAGAEAPLANPARSPRLPRPSKGTKPSKAGVAKDSSRRVKTEGADATASKKRTGMSREAAALARSAQMITGRDAAGAEGAVPKRARLKPLPYWTNPRVVFNANKEVVAVEGSEDLLGLSDRQQRQPLQQHARGPVAGVQAVKMPSKAQQLKTEPSSDQQHETGANKGEQARVAPVKASKAGAAKEPKPERRKANVAPKAAASAAEQEPGGKASKDKPVVQQDVPKAQPVTRQRDGQRSKAGGAGAKPADVVLQLPEHLAAEQQGPLQHKPAKRSKVHTEQQEGQRRAQHGKVEVEAAKQLQQLGQGAGRKEAAAEDGRGPSSAAASDAQKREAGMHRLAALALSAGVHAAQQAGRQQKARMPAAQAAPDGGAGAPGGAAATPARDGGQAPNAAVPAALPRVEGVPPDVVRQLAEQQPNQRHRCGHCRNCQRPQAKAGCLALRALREQAAPGEGAATPASPAGKQHRQSTGNRQHIAPPLPTGEVPLPASAAQQGQPGRTARQPPKAAEGGGGAKAPGSKRRAVETAAGQEPEPAGKKARVNQPVRQRQRQRQQQQQHQLEDRREDAGHPEKVEPVIEAQGEGAHVPDEAEEEVPDEQGWTGSQAAALQSAWLQINPTAPNFWQLVAKQVPGKTASDCYNRHMAKHPTPTHAARKAAPKNLLAAAKGGPRMPELKPGASKQALQNAARRYARQLQWQQKANKVQDLRDGDHKVGEGLREEMEVAEKKGRYIDQILRKRQGRPLGMAARGRKPASGPLAPWAQQQQPGGSAGGAALQVGQAAPGVRLLAATETERDVRAALAGLTPQHDSEEDRDSLEGEDYYWSDA